MQNYFAYICVSTAKQSVLGVSLQEQHSAIETYTKRYNRNIIEWFGNKAVLKTYWERQETISCQRYEFLLCAGEELLPRSSFCRRKSLSGHHFAVSCTHSTCFSVRILHRTEAIQPLSAQLDTKMTHLYGASFLHCAPGRIRSQLKALLWLRPRLAAIRLQDGQLRLSHPILEHTATKYPQHMLEIFCRCAPGRIRTSVARRRLIYSQVRLTTPPPTLNFFSTLHLLYSAYCGKRRDSNASTRDNYNRKRHYHTLKKRKKQRSSLLFS